MNLYTNLKFTRFSIPDVERFEKRLIKWCKDAYVPGISMILFDRSSLKVGGEATLEEFNGEAFYKIVLPNITLTYICVTPNMCIMLRIFENKTQSVIYNMPRKWESVEFWLGQ